MKQIYVALLTAALLLTPAQAAGAAQTAAAMIQISRFRMIKPLPGQGYVREGNIITQ